MTVDLTISDHVPLPDRSKYREIFAELQRNEGTWGRWVTLDTVRGGGLATRLRAGSYVGLTGLDYDVHTHRVGDGTFEVRLRILGRSKA